MKLQECVRYSQKGLFKHLLKRFKKDAVQYVKKSYIYVQGQAPLLLVAHLDTVHKKPVETICFDHKQNILMSPQGIGGDDRCGVYALCKVWDEAQEGRKPSLLFTCDEEIGGLGADKFAEDYIAGYIGIPFFKMIVELDRRGKDDAVYYDCANYNLEEYITGLGYCTEWGTFSDICTIAPIMGVAAVNLSCGYYNAHTLHEYINVSDLNRAIDTVQIILDEIDELPAYEWVEEEKPATAWDWKEYPSNKDWYRYYKDIYGKDWTEKWLK